MGSKLLILPYLIATSGGLILLKLGTNGISPIEFIAGKPQFHLNILSLSGIALYGISFALYIVLVSKFDLGYIFPLTNGLVYLIIFLAAFFIFKEQFTAAKVAGACLIAGGVILLNIK